MEVSGSNVVSVAEHVIMSMLLLVRNFVPAHQVRILQFKTPFTVSIPPQMISRGDWQVSEIARNAFDLEGKVVGIIGAGRWATRDIPGLPAEATPGLVTESLNDSCRSIARSYSTMTITRSHPVRRFDRHRCTPSQQCPQNSRRKLALGTSKI